MRLWNCTITSPVPSASGPGGGAICPGLTRVSTDGCAFPFARDTTGGSAAITAGPGGTACPLPAAFPLPFPCPFPGGTAADGTIRWGARRPTSGA